MLLRGIGFPRVDVAPTRMPTEARTFAEVSARVGLSRCKVPDTRLLPFELSIIVWCE